MWEGDEGGGCVGEGGGDLAEPLKVSKSLLPTTSTTCTPPPPPPPSPAPHQLYGLTLPASFSTFCFRSPDLLVKAD